MKSNPKSSLYSIDKKIEENGEIAFLNCQLKISVVIE